MCITAGSLIKPPDTLCDTSTLSLTIDNQGIATLQIIILKKSAAPITSLGASFNFRNKAFSGFIDSDTPRRLDGTDYFEHSIIAIGVIC